MAKFDVKTQSGKSLSINDSNEIQRGGEGRIILLPAKSGLVAKLYLSGVKGLNEEKFRLLQLLDKQMFVAPIDLLFINGEIVGYTMEYAGAGFFPLSALLNHSFIVRNGLSEQFRHTIARKLAEAVKSAHASGFIIGDLNQYNILLNLNGDVKFIDTDSYETANHKHTGVLLDDIRDYYYQGNVNANSDYFALSVLVFSILTFVHPFKGIHHKYKTLAERMVYKLPVFIDDPLLKVPKCYHQVHDKGLSNVFERFYLNGERFMFELNGLQLNNLVQKPQQTNKVIDGEVKIQLLANNKKIRNVFFNMKYGFIETDKTIFLYKAIAKGQLKIIAELEKTEFDEVFIGNRNVIARKDERLYIVAESGIAKEIQNFKLSSQSLISQLDSILVVIVPGQMYWVYLDEVFNNNIRNKRIEAYTEAFSVHSGLVQNSGGIQRIFYNTGKDIASVKASKSIKKIYQSGNTGLIQYVENNMTVNRYFKVTGLDMDLSAETTDTMMEYGFMPTGKENGFIFEPGDNKIVIRQTFGFQVVSEFICNKVSFQTPLFYNQSGIVAWDLENVYLINQTE
jgi:serine/threonine protein kinase